MNVISGVLGVKHNLFCYILLGLILFSGRPVLAQEKADLKQPKWIRIPGEKVSRVNGHRFFRKTFKLGKTEIKSAQLRVPAIKNLRVIINGSLVLEKGDAPVSKQVVKYLRPGENLICASLVLRTKKTWLAKLACELELTDSNGKVTRIVSDPTWVSSKGPWLPSSKKKAWKRLRARFKKMPDGPEKQKENARIAKIKEERKVAANRQKKLNEAWTKLDYDEKGWLPAEVLPMKVPSLKIAGRKPYMVQPGELSGLVVPKILGASTSSFKKAAPSSIDYIEWSGITHLRKWSRIGRPPKNGSKEIKTYEDFKAAVDTIRKEPQRQGKANEVYINWVKTKKQFISTDRACNTAAELNIKLLLTNPVMLGLGKRSHDNWKNKFIYWRHWYSYVYHFASKHGVEIYQMCNEPGYQWKDLKGQGAKAKAWGKLFFIASDAMQAAMADVNRDHNTDLELFVSGPVTAGTSKWQHYAEVLNGRLDHDLAGNPVPGRQNLGHYDYHQYAADSSKNEIGIRRMRERLTKDFGTNQFIPITLSELNVITGGKAGDRREDLSNSGRGTAVAGMLQAVTTLGDEGLGDDGGLWLFRWGTVLRSKGNMTHPVNGNAVCYVDVNNAPRNFGGVMKGGSIFQMFTTHFRGQKPLLKLKEENNPKKKGGGGALKIRTMACYDEEANAYSLFGEMSQAQVNKEVQIDLSKLNGPAVPVGSPATLQLVDDDNVGQITRIFSLGKDKLLRFKPNGNTAWHLRVSAGDTAPKMHKTLPDSDAYVTVGSRTNHGSDPTLKVSTHHDDQSKRNVSFMRFTLPENVEDDTRILLSLSGRNSGIDPEKHEILHVYLVDDDTWDEKTVSWNNAPGAGKYLKNGQWVKTDGSGPMVAIEDNYGGVKKGTGLGLSGKFIGQISFHNAWRSWQRMHLDVTDALKKNCLKNGKKSATFVIARIVRYNVNMYTGKDYTHGVYHYDDRVVEIASREHPDKDLRPNLTTIRMAHRSPDRHGQDND